MFKKHFFVFSMCLWGLCIWTSTPAKAAGRDLVFYVWSDTHFGACNNVVRRNMINQMNALPGTTYPAYYNSSAVVNVPSFLLHLGDITESGTTLQWDNPSSMDYASYIQSLNTVAVTDTFYETLGNHDSKSGNIARAEVAARHGNTYYSFDAEGIHFAVLDPYTGGSVSYPDLDTAQLNWLADDLDALPSLTPVIVTIHVHPDPASTTIRASHLGDTSSAQLASVLSGHNILAIMHGHWHTLRSSTWNGIPVIVPAGFCYGIAGCSCADGHCDEVWGVVRITDNRIITLAYNWEFDQWGPSTDVMLDRSFESPNEPHDLMAWYPFDNTADDGSDNAYHATAVNGPSYTEGVFGQAAQLDGINDYFTIPGSGGTNPDFQLSNAMTISAWIQSPPESVDFATLTAKGMASWRFHKYSRYTHMDLYSNETDPINFTHGNFSWLNTFDNQWHHIAVTFGNGFRTLYVDGEINATQSHNSGSITATADMVWIGGNSGSSGRCWKGKIDDMAIFNYALAGHEIRFIKDHGMAAYRSTQQYYVAPVALGDGSGTSADNAGLYTDVAFWDAVNSTLQTSSIEVIFLDGTYTSPVTVNDIRHSVNTLYLTGETSNGVIFNGAGLHLRGLKNCIMKYFNFTGTVSGYAHSVGKSTTGVSSEQITIDHCNWMDLDVVYGATGVHNSSHHVTYADCTFQRIAPSTSEHMIYNAYNSHHITIKNCYFEDCTGDYIRFRDDVDFGAVIDCTFKSTAAAYDQYFIRIPVFNDVNPGHEWLATQYLFYGNTFDHYAASSNLYATGFYHKGYSPANYTYLLTAVQGDILENGTPAQKRQLLLDTCGIDAGEVMLADNNYQTSRKMSFGSYTDYGAISLGWEGTVDISDLMNPFVSEFAWPEFHDLRIPDTWHRQGDFNLDGVIDLDDLADYFLPAWMSTYNQPNYNIGSDFDLNDIIDLRDFSQMAEDWLRQDE